MDHEYNPQWIKLDDLKGGQRRKTTNQHQCKGSFKAKPTTLFLKKVRCHSGGHEQQHYRIRKELLMLILYKGSVFTIHSTIYIKLNISAASYDQFFLIKENKSFHEQKINPKNKCVLSKLTKSILN